MSQAFQINLGTGLGGLEGDLQNLLLFLRFQPLPRKEQRRQLAERENTVRAREVAALGRERTINEERAALERHRFQQREYEVQQNTRDRALADREVAVSLREQAVDQWG